MSTSGNVSKKVRAIYLAKCKDLGIPPTKSREARFMEIFQRNCSGTTFDMSDQGLGPNTSIAISALLTQNDAYTSVLLSGNMVQGPGAASLAQLLMVNTSITRLDLRSNDIDTLGGIALFKALETNQTLTSLDLSGAHGVNRNHLGGKCADAIARVLQNNQVLYRLCLSENGFGSEGVLRIAAGFGNTSGGRGKATVGAKGVNVGIGVLDLGHNSLGWDGCVGLCRALAGSAVEELLLPGNHIGDNGVGAVSELLTSKTPSITVLDLAANNITQKGIRTLGEALQNGASITSLNLANNTLGHAGVRALAEAINNYDHISTLILSQTQIDSVACTELSEALRRNFALTKLDMQGNRIGDDGAASLSEVLEFNHKLVYLDLASNHIGDEGGCTLADMVQHNTTLRHLELKNNDLRDSAAIQLARAMQTNNTLLHLGVETNDFEYRFIHQIEQRVAENQRKYKAESIIRYQREISALRVDEDRLHRLSLELQEVTTEQQQKELEAQNMLQEMENIEEKYRQNMVTLHDTIQERSKSITRYETKQVAVLKEISRFKAEKELKVRNLVAKIHKERDTNQRLEKKVMGKTHELAEMKASGRKEIERLAEILRVELFDRKQAELEMEQMKKVSMSSRHSSRATTPSLNATNSTKDKMNLTVSVGDSGSGDSSPSKERINSLSGSSSGFPSYKLNSSMSSPAKDKLNMSRGGHASPTKERLSTSTSGLPSPSKDKLGSSSGSPLRLSGNFSKEANILTVHNDLDVSVYQNAIT